MMEPRWLALFGCLCAVFALGLSAAVPKQEQDTLVVSRSEEEGSSPSPVIEDEPATTTEKEITTEGPTPPVKLLEMKVRSEVSLRYAHTAVVTKVRNPAKKAQQATFRVLLPETAFISGFVMTLDGKSYKAYVKEKDEAKKIYSDAVNAGIGAAHIAAKARDSNHFTVSVNVEPNTSAVFNLTYEELLVRRNNVYNHAINLHPGTLVPKLTVTVHIKEAQKITALRVPEIRTGNEIDATEEDAQNSKAVIERGHDDREATITFSPDLEEQRRLIAIYAEKTKESQSHTHHYWDSPGEEAKPEGVLGQFVVQYDVDRPKEGEILVNDGYFVHFFAPTDLPPLNKHVVFVLDTSGSMMERKITQLREAMQTILGELNPGDYFNIVEFASYVKVHDLKEADLEPAKDSNHFYSYSWDEKPATLVPPSPATPANIARAKVIVSRLNANGGTNIASALNIAVDLIKKGTDWKPEATTAKPASNDAPHAEPLADNPPTPTTPTTPTTPATTTEVAAAQPNKDESKKLEPIIIFLTDGDPTVGETDPTRIINRLVEKNYGHNKAAIFSLAFGEDADRNFLRKLSLRSEGFMRHIYEAADAALQLRDFYRQVSSPLLADVHFNYPKNQIKEGSLTKHKFRAYYAGSEAVVAGRVAADARELAPSVVAVCGVDDLYKRKKFEIFPKVPVARPAGQYLPLERLWAYLTIKQLLDEKDAGDHPSDSEDTPEKKALEIALKYEFVTPLTSLVVVKPNDTSAVNAESVDKQNSPFGVPLAAHGVGGLPGAAAPQFAYKAALSSAIGHVISRPLAQSAPALPMLDSEYSIAYEAAEEIVDYPDGGRRGRTRSKPIHFLKPATEHYDSLDHFDHLERNGPSQAQYLPEEDDQDKKRGRKTNDKRPAEIQLTQHTTPVAISTIETTSVSRGPPVSSYTASSFSRVSFRSGGPIFRSAAQSHPLRIAPGAFYSAAALPAPRRPPIFLPDPVIDATPSTTLAPTQNPLAPLHLEEFPWVTEALKSDVTDKISLDVLRNETLSHLELELVRNVDVPKEASDAECKHATDGASGVCVYLTRCDAAKSITLDQYKQSYCFVNNRFAGVCCPRAKVDVDAPIP